MAASLLKYFFPASRAGPNFEIQLSIELRGFRAVSDGRGQLCHLQQPRDERGGRSGHGPAPLQVLHGHVAQHVLGGTPAQGSLVGTAIQRGK